MVKDVRVDGGRVKLKIELTTPACPLKGKIQADAEAALKAVPGVTRLDIEWGAQVRAAPAGDRQGPAAGREEHHAGGRRQGRGGQEHRGGEPGRRAGAAAARRWACWTRTSTAPRSR